MENTVITFDSFSKFQEVIRNAKSLPFNRAILNGNVKDLKASVLEFGIQREINLIKTSAFSNDDTEITYIVDGHHPRLIIDSLTEDDVKNSAYSIRINYSDDATKIMRLVSTLNSTGKKWNLKNYANAWAKLGNENYIKLLDFAKKEKLPLNPLIIAFDGEKGGNGNMNFKDGKFEFKYTARLKEVFRIYNHAIDLGLERSQQSFNGFVRVYSCNYFKEKKFYRCVEVKCAGTKGIKNRDVYYNIFSEYLQK